MNILDKIEKEISEQTRNGREDLYISTDDLEALGMSGFQNKGRVWIKEYQLKIIIKAYKEKIKKEIER